MAGVGSEWRSHKDPRRTSLRQKGKDRNRKRIDGDKEASAFGSDGERRELVPTMYR